MSEFVEQLKYVLCSTVYVRNSESKFLLLFHRKLNKWVPPGGKIACDEMPPDAAIRECFEETGLRIELIGDRPVMVTELLKPIGIEYNNPEPPNMPHLDFIYFGKPVGDNNINININEAIDIKWFSLDQISKLDTFEAVYVWCHRYQNLRC